MSGFGTYQTLAILSGGARGIHLDAYDNMEELLRAAMRKVAVETMGDTSKLDNIIMDEISSIKRDWSDDPAHETEDEDGA